MSDLHNVGTNESITTVNSTERLRGRGSSLRNVVGRQDSRCRDSLDNGRPVQILKFNDHHKFVLDVQALGEILLNNDIRRKPLVVLSIAGDFRKGKSFMLNHLLCYLNTGCNASKWLHNLKEPLKGFTWRGGSERDTSGIVMWSKPFFVRDENDREIGIILMDTQGAFDNEFTFKDSALVFALSTMTSSIQVFNLMHNLQDDDLQILEFFSEYGRLALECIQEKPFQKLMFLIRDWSYPYEHSYGFQGGSTFLEKKLIINENMPDELQRARKRICDCFREIGCFLMPHPGPVVATSQQFDGRAEVYDKVFLHYLREFVPNILHPQRLMVKKIAGREVTGWELLEYFKIYAEIFESDNMPEPKNLFDATAEANNLTAMRKAFETYLTEMNEICTSRSYILPPRLQDIHNQIYSECLREFDGTLKIGGEEYSEKYREKLVDDIMVLYEQFKSNNKQKNLFGMFGTPFVMILFSTIFYIIGLLLSIVGLRYYSEVSNSLSMLSIIVGTVYIILQYTRNYSELTELVDAVAERAWTAFDEHIMGRLLRSVNIRDNFVLNTVSQQSLR